MYLKTKNGHTPGCCSELSPPAINILAAAAIAAKFAAAEGYNNNYISTHTFLKESRAVKLCYTDLFSSLSTVQLLCNY